MLSRQPLKSPPYADICVTQDAIFALKVAEWIYRFFKYLFAFQQQAADSIETRGENAVRGLIMILGVSIKI